MKYTPVNPPPKSGFKILITPKKVPHIPLKAIPTPVPHTLRKPLIYFILLLCYCGLITSVLDNHIRGILQSVFFCLGLLLLSTTFLRFIQVVSTVCSFLLLSRILLCKYIKICLFTRLVINILFVLVWGYCE